jgi:hypothetical protein
MLYQKRNTETSAEECEIARSEFAAHREAERRGEVTDLLPPLDIP